MHFSFRSCFSGRGAVVGLSLGLALRLGAQVPTITAQPAGLTAALGSPAAFTVVATGATGYQWFRNGLEVQGGTAASLAISRIYSLDAGYYTVRVSNGSGSVDSAPALLKLADFGIATTPAQPELSGGVASDGTGFLAAIRGDGANAAAVMAQRLSAGGALIGPRISLGRNCGDGGGAPAIRVAYGEGRYFLVWQDGVDSRIWGGFVGTDGTASAAIALTNTGATNPQAAMGVVFDGFNFIVIYGDGPGKQLGLNARRVSPTGVVGPEMPLASNAAGSIQAVACNGFISLVAWQEFDGGTGTSSVKGCFVPTEDPPTAAFVIDGTPSPSYNPLCVASNGSNFLVVWNFDTGPGIPSPVWELRGRLLTASGPVAFWPVFQVAGNAQGPLLPAAVFDGSNYLVTWLETRQGTNDVAGRYFSGQGGALGAAFSVAAGAGAQGIAAVARGGEQCLVAFNDGFTVVAGLEGGDVRGVLLERSAAPAIITAPLSQTVPAGADASLSIVATGPAATYQWFKNGAPLSGATGPTLGLPGVDSSAFGAYAVTLQNAFGTVTSQLAYLGVSAVGGPTYRLLDYFYPTVPGNRWVFNGPGGSPETTHALVEIGALETPINCYSGRYVPAAYPQTAVALQRCFGVERGGVFTPAAGSEWTEFFRIDGGQLAFWGSNRASEDLRVDGGVPFPVAMAVGESFAVMRDAYLFGNWVGDLSFAGQVVGVESVTVAAGTFPACLHLRYFTTTADGTEEVDEWWAPGVGAVKHLGRIGAAIDARELLRHEVQLPMAPAIVAAPAGASVALGETASLSVGATGTGPLSYRWYRGERGDVASPVEGATAAGFTTPALTAWARYWVRVSNLFGSIDSPVALVKVTGGTVTLADWTAQAGVPASQRGPGDAPAGDGVANLTKFVLGVHPMADPSLRLPRAVLVPATGGKALGIEFTYNPNAVGFTLTLQTQGGLGAGGWNDVVASVVPLGSPNPDGTVKGRLSEATPAGGVRRFARLKIALP